RYFTVSTPPENRPRPRTSAVRPARSAVSTGSVVRPVASRSGLSDAPGDAEGAEGDAGRGGPDARGAEPAGTLALGVPLGRDWRTLTAPIIGPRSPRPEGGERACGGRAAAATSPEGAAVSRGGRGPAALRPPVRGP